RDVAHLRGQVGGHRVDRVREIFPGAADAGHFGLSTELAFGADLAGDTRDFRSERVELVGHCVDGVLELQDLAFDVDGDLAGEVTLGDGGGDVGDVSHLRGQVRCHEVDRVGQILPRAGDALDLRLTAELAFGTDFTSDASHFRGKA